MHLKRVRKVLSLVLSLAMLCTIISPALAYAPPTEDGVTEEWANGFSEDQSKYEIYPVPHVITYQGDQAFTMTSSVNVVAEAGVDTYTQKFLEEILADYGLTMTSSEAIVAGKTNILLGVKDSDGYVDTYADAIPVADATLFTRIDAYLLNADATEHSNGIITVLGRDADSTYYGLATLQMMFSSFAGKRFLPVHIEDYSDVIYRGFIEGFYGGFDYAGRESQMRSIRDVKGNIYVFASKTDPYHGEDWDVLYPQEELDQIAHLAQVGLETKVDYTWSVHIGKGGFFNNASSDPSAGTRYQTYLTRVEQLKAKFQQLYDVGVRNFHILNDDYNSGTNADVVALLNDINAWRTERGCGPIVYCPKGYNVGWAGNGSELAALKDLDEDIYIYWTGSDVNSPITQSNIDYPYEKSNHYPVTWLNYPCSEHGKSGMFLGNIDHYVSGADGLTGQMGIISNPVNYPEANKVAYFQLLCWGWNRDNYTSYGDQLWEDCFKYLQPEVYEAYLTLARNISNCPGSGRITQGFAESEYLKASLESVQAKVLSGAGLADDAEVAALLQELTDILSAVEEFRSQCDNANLVAELSPWLSSLEGVAQAGKSALEAAIALQTGDLDGAWSGFAAASIALDTWDDYKTPNYAEVIAKAGSKRLQPFADKLVTYVKTEISSILNPGGLGDSSSFYAVLGGEVQSSSGDCAKIFDDNASTYASFRVNQQQDDYFGVDLGAVKEVHSIDILQGQNDTHHDYFHNATLESSVDGKNWVSLVVNVNSRHIQISDLALSARYVRLRLLETGYGSKADYWTDIREFTVKTRTDAGDDSPLYTNLSLSGDIEVAVDGGTYTLPALTGLTLEPGDYVGIRLPEVMAVKDVALHGSLPEGVLLQYSANGVVWADGAPNQETSVRYMRVVNLSDSAVSGDLPGLAATAAATATNLSFHSTNISKIYSGSWANVVDGDHDSQIWTGAAQTQGDYIIFDLGALQPVYDVSLFAPETGDYPLDMEISLGATSDPAGEWTAIGSFTDGAPIDPPYRCYSCDAEGQLARYVKLTTTKTSTKWMKLNELEVNQSQEEVESRGALSGIPHGDFEKAMDGNLSTFFTPGEVTMQDGFFQYLISDFTRIPTINIFQSPSNISRAQVKVQTADETWQTIGQLDRAACSFDTSALGDLLALRLEWEQGTSPAIAEIVLLQDGSGTGTGEQEIPMLFPNIYEPSMISVDDIEVNYGTPFEMVGLPDQVEVTISNGAELMLPITWTCDGYDGGDPGTYTARGTYDLGETLTNPGCFALTAAITVKKAAGTPPVEPFTGNLALDQPVEVSGYEGGGAPQGNEDVVTNGITASTDINQRWSSNYMKGENGMVEGQQTPSWVIVDLGEDVTDITAVKAYFHAKVWPTHYEIQVSPDGEDHWTTVKTITRADGSMGASPIDTIDVFDAPIPEGVRYIRLYFHTVNTAAAGHCVGLIELEVEGARGGTGVSEPENLALEQDIYVSGVEVTNQTHPYMAVDGDSSTRWSSNMMKVTTTSDAWIVVDLGQDVEHLSEISMEYFKKVWPTDYLVQVAGDDFNPVDFSGQNIGANHEAEGTFTGQNAIDAPCWTTLQTYSGLSSADNPTEILSSGDFAEEAPEGVRYIRLYFTGVNAAAAGHCIGLEELTVTGTRTQTPAAELTVASVTELTATGRLGVEFDMLDLPQHVVATLTDGTCVRLPVSWDGDGFDPDTTDPQEISGTLDLHGTDITNDEGIQAKLTLTLADIPSVVSVLVNPSSMTVKAGTPFAQLPLPDQAVAQLDSGSAVVCEVVWNEDEYHGDISGYQVVTGALTLPEDVSNPDSVMASMTVQVTGSVEPPEPSDPPTSSEDIYKVVATATAGGTITPASVSAEAGDSRTFTLTPEKGYQLVSLTLDGEPVDFDLLSGPGAGGSYTFRLMYISDSHKLRATFEAESGSDAKDFTDIDGHWAEDAILWAVEQGLMNGTGGTSFTPNATTTRAMAATVLWRMADQPAAKTVSPFTDTPDGMWYSTAIAWASESGIVEGVGENLFAPNREITRQEMAAILWRYAKWSGSELTGSAADLAGFPDAGQVADWAAEAMAWAVNTKLINGRTGGLLVPQGTAQRAELATILQRFSSL